MKRLAQFLFEAGMLKRTPRTGYQFLGSGGESVADHTFRTAIIGYALASREPEADAGRVVLMCLFHDLPETRTGDHNYMNKKYVTKDEAKALEDQLRGLPFAAEITDLMEEFNRSRSLEARLARDADQLDLILELKEQWDLGNPNAREWLTFALKRLMTANAKGLAQEIMGTHSSHWWFDKKSEWWVNGPGGPEA